VGWRFVWCYFMSVMYLGIHKSAAPAHRWVPAFLRQGPSSNVASDLLVWQTVRRLTKNGAFRRAAHNGIRCLPAVVVLLGATAMLLAAQSTAGKQPAFDVASVKPNKSGNPPTANFPLGPGDVFPPNGGSFSATNLSLVTYLFFAYKIMGNESQFVLPQLPGWASTDRFDIQARAEGNPGKDEMRLMMRSLLAERFKLTVHQEKRQVPVFALVLVKPGKFGPHLQLHPADAPCSLTPIQRAADLKTIDGGFPATCNGLFPLPASEPDHLRMGSQNVTVGFLANAMSSMADLGRPLVDRTGIAGTVDFVLEWARGRRIPAQPGAGADPQSDLPAGPSFQQALKEQLGIKLEAEKAPMDMLVIDHVEHPSEN